MYTTTFYSYKGGVGRTMALANIGFLLASSGKRVLLVDFDLEAPGLSTYEPFRCAAGRHGIVEYVSSYIDTNEAPDVRDFIMSCEFHGQTMWFMPAGRYTDSDYTSRLNSIDWKVLYEERSGFLFMEDLKQQWAEFDGRGFDYVLIDSRTGHTDVGGICTRQLPDAVVIMFVPTPQNIEGLQPIVRSITRERAPVRKNAVRLHFCPSNVPDLDDQESILRTLLDDAAHKLGYKEPSGLIQHFQSLELLQQPVYAAVKPKSRLVREYADLERSIISGNLEDRDGAIAALARMVSQYESARSENDPRALEQMGVDAAQIRSSFPNDGRVAWQLAILANKMVRPDEELSALNVVVESGEDVRFARLRRAHALATLGDRQAAVEDLRTLLQHEAVTVFESRSAVDLAQVLDPAGWRQLAEVALANERMDVGGKYHILEALLNDRNYVERTVELARTVLARLGGRSLMIENVYVLALIANGQFEEAMNAIRPEREDILSANFAAEVFNYAVAEWGARGSASKDLFRRVISLSLEHKDVANANGAQCQALCYLALGEYEFALEQLRTAKAKSEGVDHVFSCWRYLTVSAQEMIDDVESMKALAEVRAIVRPPTRGGFKSSNLPLTH